MKHSRIALLATAVGLAAVGALQAETVLKVGLIDPPAHIDVKAAEMMAEKVKEATNGEIVMDVYPASQLGFAADMLSGMKLGTVEMFVGATTWLGAFDKDWWISGTPYIFNDQEQARAVHEGALFQGMADKLAETEGIRVLVQDWDRGPRNFIATEPVETIDDLKGLKIRVPPQDSWIQNFQLAGAAPVPMALTETFTGLQQGIVTATEQASNWLYANKYHTIANNLTRTGHNYEETGVMISEPVWQSLTEQQRAAVLDAAKGLTQWHNEQLLTEISDAETAMKDEGVNIVDVDVAKWKAQFRENFDKVAQSVGYSPEVVQELKSQWD